MSAEAAAWRCARCDEALITKKTVFNYLGQSFTHDVPCCPKCGNVLITPDLARGKMAQVEEQLEDK
jgi:NAD-dependent SIR2 family protein deacetylase